jgi:PEP-CTERM motif
MLAQIVLALELAVILAASCLAAVQAHASTLTFDNNAGCASSSAQPGAYALGQAGTSANTACAYQDQGLSFAALSRPVSKGNRVNSRSAVQDTMWSQSLILKGTYANGTTVSFSLAFDGNSGFQTVALPGSFANLSNLEVLSTPGVLNVTTFDGNGRANGGLTQVAAGTASLDNVNFTTTTVTAVPEPSTVALFGLPLLAVLATARRRNRLAKDAEVATTSSACA